MNPLRLLKIAALPVALIAAALIVAARANHGTPTGPDPSAATESADDATHFREGNGVRLSKSAWDFIQPATTEIQTMEVAPDLKAEARVYAAADDLHPALASALLPADAAFTAGQAVEICVTLGERPGWQGKVSRIDRQMEPVSGQVEAIIEITDPERKLTVGTFLSVSSASAEVEKVSVSVVPWSAVVQSSKGPFVYAANGDYFLRTPVQLGARHADRVEIVDGLFEGDKVVSKGADALWMVELQAANAGESCTAGH